MRFKDYQARVGAWLLACFSENVARSRRERALRFLEEAVELAQAEGLASEDAELIVSYVYGRPKGEAAQEVGGVAVTLSALCAIANIDLEQAALAEAERIETPEVMDLIRQKRMAKANYGIGV